MKDETLQDFMNKLEVNEKVAIYKNEESGLMYPITLAHLLTRVDYLELDEKEIKVRFLAIDTPETGETEEPFGKEASEFTCGKLKFAKKIEIEYDDNAEKKDKYDRELVWVFVDDRLLQEEIVEKGYGEVTYLYGDYKYINILKRSESIAKRNSLNIWSTNEDYKEAPYILLVLIIGPLIILVITKIKREKSKISKILKRK